MSKIAALVLAAGLASRFRAAAGTDGPATKLIAAFDGKPLVRHVAEAALASSARPVVVVTGHARQAVEAALAGMSLSFVENPAFATGLASSLRAGVAALPADVEGAVVLLGDMPRISAALIDRLVATYTSHPLSSAVAPLFAGRRGNPVLIARSLFGEVAQLSGDVGARPLLEGRHDVVDVAIEDDGVTFDVDLPSLLGGGVRG